MYGVFGSTVACNAALDCYPCNCCATDQRGLFCADVHNACLYAHTRCCLGICTKAILVARTCWSAKHLFPPMQQHLYSLFRAHAAPPKGKGKAKAKAAPKAAKAKATGLTAGRKVAAAAKSKGRAASGSPAPGQGEALAEGAAGGQVPAFRVS